MTDIRADDGGPLDREERLPWLEAVEEEDASEGPSALKLIVAVLIGLAAIGGIVGGVFWMQKRGDSAGGPDAEMIRADSGSYKVRPEKPGGMTVEGEGDTAFAASAGADPKGQINPNAVPEAPVNQAGGQAPAAQAQGPAATPPAPAPAAKPAPQPAEVAAKSAPAASGEPGGTVQLGAFPNGAIAESAWKALSGRFGYLAPLSHSVVAAQVNGKTWYRLRASGPGAAGICGRLRVAGENCLRID
jgi:SPOR domain